MKKCFKALLICILAFFMVACSNTATKPNEDNKDNNNSEKVNYVTVKDIHGEVKVPTNPERIVSLDNRTFETLSDWNIKLLAVPKLVMAKNSKYVLDENVKDIGNHREPNFEILASLDPQLVIVGQRFAKYYQQIKELVPNAAVVDFSFDVSNKAKNPGQNLVNGFIEITNTLATIFGKDAEAKSLIERFNNSINAVKSAYNKDDKVMSVVVSGGKIGYAAPMYGRVWGPLYEIFNFTPSLEVKDSTSDHKGDDISVEAIANSNPDWLFVLDRDANTNNNGSKDSLPAKDVIAGSEALKNVNAIKNNHIVIAPDDTYVNESIQTFIKIFETLADVLKK